MFFFLNNKFPWPIILNTIPGIDLRCRREHRKHLQVPHAASAKFDEQQWFGCENTAAAACADAGWRRKSESQSFLESFQSAVW